MKKLLIIVIISIPVLSGCNKLLEKEPDARAKLDSPVKVAQLLGSAYPQWNYQTMAELPSDNADDAYKQELNQPDWLRLTQNLYTYNDNTVNPTPEDTPEGYWFACYRAIAACNLALQAIEKVPAEQQKDYKASKGEALVARAYSHFMLVNFFSKFYDQTTASTDLGIPYVTEPEEVSVKRYDRKTVQYVYDMVEKDLHEGMALIDDNSYTVPSFHFTKKAANAFAARFYLYKKEMDSVIKYATAAIPEGSFKNYLRPWNTTYQNYPLNGNGNLGQMYEADTDPANLLLAESQTWWLYFFGQGRFVMSQSLVGYASGTAHVANGSWPFRAVSFGLSGHQFIPKMDLQYFVETSLGSGIGTKWNMITLFSAEEVLFNLAEAHLYKGENQAAIDLLNTYLSSRLMDYDPVENTITEESITAFYATPANVPLLKVEPFFSPTASTKAILNILMDYRQVEFLQEGLRWFDVLRYKIEVKHYVYKDQLKQETPDSIILDINNTHRVFELPPSVLSQGELPGNR